MLNVFLKPFKYRKHIKKIKVPNNLITSTETVTVSTILILVEKAKEKKERGKREYDFLDFLYKYIKRI